MSDEILQAIITALGGFVLFVAGFLVNFLTGKNRADVRETNAKARESEVKSEMTAFDLATKALAEIGEMRERITALEKENGDLKAEIIILRAENIELKRRLDNKGRMLK